MGPILVVSFLVSINYKREDRQNGKAVVFSSRPTGSLQTQQLLNKRVFLGKPISGLDRYKSSPPAKEGWLGEKRADGVVCFWQIHIVFIGFAG